MLQGCAGGRINLIGHDENILYKKWVMLPDRNMGGRGQAFDNLQRPNVVFLPKLTGALLPHLVDCFGLILGIDHYFFTLGLERSCAGDVAVIRRRVSLLQKCSSLGQFVSPIAIEILLHFRKSCLAKNVLRDSGQMIGRRKQTMSSRAG